jgi:glutamate formiminotransferase
MADCVALARTVGRAVADRFGIPVFLYEEAATAPARRNLAEIRRGGLAGLAARMTEPAWRPDFGPSRPHPRAGATVIGARKPLIAYNINLATTRREVARAIAGAVRERGGGLRCVKAIPITLADGTAQVSMNLTDFEVTSPMQVYDAVQREAAKHGVEVRDSELIGLIPEAALADADLTRLRIRGFDGSQVLEYRLKHAP